MYGKTVIRRLENVSGFVRDSARNALSSVIVEGNGMHLHDETNKVTGLPLSADSEINLFRQMFFSYCLQCRNSS